MKFIVTATVILGKELDGIFEDDILFLKPSFQRQFVFRVINYIHEFQTLVQYGDILHNYSVFKSF